MDLSPELRQGAGRNVEEAEPLVKKIKLEEHAEDGIKPEGISAPVASPQQRCNAAQSFSPRWEAEMKLAENALERIKAKEKRLESKLSQLRISRILLETHLGELEQLETFNAAGFFLAVMYFLDSHLEEE